MALLSADGTKILDNYDRISGVPFNASIVTTWWDGTPMNDSKVDNFVYFKNKTEFGGGYAKRDFDDSFFIEKDTMLEMRGISNYEKALLKTRVALGVRLNGYYTKGDTPLPINYIISITAETDNGGSVVQIGDFKLEHIFQDSINTKYFGAFPSTTVPVSNSIISTIASKGFGITFETGTYMFSSVTLTTNTHFKGSGNVIFKLPPTGTPNRIITCDNQYLNFTLENITFDFETKGANFIYVQNCNTFTAINVTVKNLGLVGFSLGHTSSVNGIRIDYASKVYIQNCNFYSIQRDAISINGGVRDAYVKDCFFENIGRFAVSTQQVDSQIIKNVYYTNNTLFDCKNGGFHIESNVGQNVPNAMISGNSIYNCGNDDWGYGRAIVLGTNTKGIVSGNYIENFGNSASGGTLVGIRVSNNIESTRIENNIINTVLGGQSLGIQIDGESNLATAMRVSACNNTIINVGNGFLVRYIYYAEISNNHIENCSRNGIFFTDCRFSYTKDNVIINISTSADNTYDGIYYTADTQINVISGNFMSIPKGRYGINIDQTANRLENVNIQDNRIIGAITSWFNFSQGCSDGYIVNGKKTYYGTAIPTTGTWLLGDRVLNTSTSMGNAQYWVCTTAGTPGAWKAVGLRAIALADISQANLTNITTPDATDEATAITLVNVIKTFINTNAIPLINATKTSQNTELANQRTAGQQAP